MNKKEKNENVEIIMVENGERYEKKEESTGGLGSLISRFFKFCAKVIKKGNVNYFEIRKNGEKPIKVSLTISTILLFFAWWFILVTVVIALFFDYKYSLTGPDFNDIKVNEIFNRISVVANNMKSSFKKSAKSSN